LVKNKGLVKTVRFKDPKYVGDPINAVRIFNEKEADELMVLDIDATSENRASDFNMIKNLAAECRMPLCYGGGVKTADQAKRIISLGAEKVAVSSAVIENPGLVTELAKAVGCQSVVVVLDVMKRGIFKKYEIVIENGTKPTGKYPVEFSKQLDELGIGEIVINSVDNDGMMQGYDTKLIRKIRDAVDVPITVLGGAGSFSDIKNVIDEFGVIGAAAGSLFVFKGKYRAVLISYPNPDEKLKIIKDYLK
jgi:imidazole glycerol-phosphate synthase subunit HisF